MLVQGPNGGADLHRPHGRHQLTQTSAPSGITPFIYPREEARWAYHLSCSQQSLAESCMRSAPFHGDQTVD